MAIGLRLPLILFLCC